MKFILGACFAAIVFMYGLFNPAYNWDIIGYVAASHYNLGVRGEKLRDFTFQEIKSVVDDKTYAELVSATPYRVTVATNPESITQQMPFYTIRMAYLFTLKITSELLNITFAESTFIVASLFAGLCVAALFIGFNSANSFSLITFPIIILFSGFPDIARYSTPDTMAAFFAIISFFYFRKIWWIAMVTLTVATVVRTDFVILAGLLGLCAAYRRKLVPALSFLIVPAIAYLLVNRLNANYGYLKILNFTLIHNDPFPETMSIATTIAPYLKIYGDGFSALLGHRHFLAYIALVFVWFKNFRKMQNPVINENVFIILGFVFLHMLLFPAYYPRFFTWCAALAGLELMRWLSQIYFEKKSYKLASAGNN
ncbi:hypothetical protein ACES2L_07110 [Bdellovibrio bacteriovorus]